MTGLIIGGKAVPVPGIPVSNWASGDPRLRLRRGEDMRVRRSGAPRAIVLHTTQGIPGGRNKRPQDVRTGLGTDSNAELRVARYWSTNGQPGGAHLVVDFDGSVACLADLLSECAYHVGGCAGMNDRSVGIEIAQGVGAELYTGQLAVAARLAAFICEQFPIRKLAQFPYRGRPLRRFANGCGDFSGVIGHRDCDSNRGAGDPGDAAMVALSEAGVGLFDFDEGVG